RAPPALHSFPTRRSSDLGLALAVLALVGDDAELREFERLQLDLAGRELFAETLVFKYGLAVLFDLGGEILDAAQPLLGDADAGRSEEHTSELQSRENLVC